MIGSLRCETGGDGGGTGSETMNVREEETLKSKFVSKGNGVFKVCAWCSHVEVLSLCSEVGYASKWIVLVAMFACSRLCSLVALSVRGVLGWAMLSCISALWAWGGLCFLEVPDQLHKYVLKVHKWPSCNVKEGKWCAWQSLGTSALAPAALGSPKVYKCYLPVIDVGYTAAYFLSFVGVQSKALKINCEALQRIYLCHSGCINH